MTLTIDIGNLLFQIRLLRARDLFQYAHGFALVMPYYELGNLYSVNASEHFDLAKKKEATRQVLDGLHDLHRLLRIY